MLPSGDVRWHVIFRAAEPQIFQQSGDKGKKIPRSRGKLRIGGASRGELRQEIAAGLFGVCIDREERVEAGDL